MIVQNLGCNSGPRLARRRSTALAASTCLSLLGASFAHAEAGASDGAGGGQPPRLGEVVVTATRRADTVDRVALSITALPQEALQQQQIRSLQDISRATPGLFVTPSNAPNGSAISVRGIASGLGPPTTAIYIDDIPLQKRIVAGDASGSGSPYPQLYDLDRVEVLKGPQGTLFGESSEGGAVRFITPTPSLTTYSGTARAEVSGTEDGGVNVEGGAAVGGPLVKDVLGLRLSVWDRHDSGYIDHVFAYTGQTLGTNTNSEDRFLARISLLYQPTPNLKITPGFYISRDRFADSDAFTENVPAFTAKAGANIAAHTYGPFNQYGPYKTILNCNIGQNFVGTIAPCFERSPRVTDLTVSSLNIDYDFKLFSLHSSTGFVTDKNEGLANAALGDISSFQSGIPFLYNYPQYFGNLQYHNTRDTLTEELRISSNPNPGPFKWVGGFFYSDQITHQTSQDYANLDGVVQDLFGLTTAQILGAPSSPDGGISQRYQKVKETEYAGFGEVTFAATHHLNATAGIRVAHDQIAYHGYLEGPFFGYVVPTAANGGLSGGVQTTTAVLPKFNLQYAFDAEHMIYATAAKGERVGGVNAGVYASKCASTLTRIGLASTPGTYNPDSLWSYEVGAKGRLLGGRAQLNASAYWINWSNVQVTYTLPAPCSFSFVSNAGGAVSRGGDVQAEINVFDGLTATVAAAYTNAYYSTAVVVGSPVISTFINKGDALPVPPWSLEIGVRYDFPMLAAYKAYLRGDYQYTSPYKRGFGPGTSTYNPDTYRASLTQFVKLRAGFVIHDTEVALFVDNLFNSQDILARTGGGVCNPASCVARVSYNPIFMDTTFRPRTVGLSMNYKY